MGLVITWVLWPVEFKNADLADLRQSLKDDYVRMIGAAYVLDGDLVAAQRRLQSLGLGNATQTFEDLITREKRNSGDSSTQDALIHLGQALGLRLPYTAQGPAPGAPTPAMVFVVATPTAAVPAFRLVERTQLSCTDEPETAHFRIVVRDAAGRDLPNIGIEIRSGDISETIYTGL